MTEQKVLNCDCIEFMKTLKDDAYDLAIVDPPYGVGSITYMPRTRHKAIGGFIDEYNITVATLDMNNRKKNDGRYCTQSTRRLQYEIWR